jgi:hypothetical protein
MEGRIPYSRMLEERTIEVRCEDDLYLKWGWERLMRKEEEISKREACLSVKEELLQVKEQVVW